MLTTPERAGPQPALFENAFLQALKSLGLSAGGYNLVAVRGGADGLRASLASLFEVTPPTAMIVADSEHFWVTQGKEDLRQQLYDAEFVEGGTIGPV